jgi:hypothetical protein
VKRFSATTRLSFFFFFFFFSRATFLGVVCGVEEMSINIVNTVHVPTPMDVTLSQLVPFMLRYIDCDSLPPSLRPTRAALAACRSRLRTPSPPPDGSVALWTIVRHVIQHDGTPEREDRAGLAQRMWAAAREIARGIDAGFDARAAGFAIDALFGIAVANAAPPSAAAGSRTARTRTPGREASVSFADEVAGISTLAGSGAAGGGGGDQSAATAENSDPVAPLHWLLMNTLCSSPTVGARIFALCVARRHCAVYVDPAIGPSAMAREMHAAAQACLVDPNSSSHLALQQVAIWVATMLERGVDADIHSPSKFEWGHRLASLCTPLSFVCCVYLSVF